LRDPRGALLHRLALVIGERERGKGTLKQYEIVAERGVQPPICAADRGDLGQVQATLAVGWAWLVIEQQHDRVREVLRVDLGDLQLGHQQIGGGQGRRLDRNAAA